MDIYKEYYEPEFIQKVENAETAIDKLTLINDESKKHSYSLYLIIDEYDNFTNTVLNEQGKDVYWCITHAEGFYRDQLDFPIFMPPALLRLEDFDGLDEPPSS